MYTALMAPPSSRSASIGPNRPTMPNSTVNASQRSSHASRPNTNMPPRVITVYVTAARATICGRLAMPLVSSRHAKAR